MPLVLGAALHQAFLALLRCFWGAVCGERPWEAGGGRGPPTPSLLCIHTGSLPRLAGDSGPKGLGVPSCPSPVGKMLGPPVQKPTLHRSISTKVLLAEGEETPFMEHCRHFEDSYRVSPSPSAGRRVLGGATFPCVLEKAPPLLTRAQWPSLVLATPLRPLQGHSWQGPCTHSSVLQHLQAETQSLKDQVQELHRDLTKHHSLIKAEIMGDILRKALQVDARIAAQCASVEGMRALFQEVAPLRTRLPAAHPSARTGPPRTDGWGEGRVPWPAPAGLVWRLWNLGLCCLEPWERAGGALQLWVAGGQKFHQWKCQLTRCPTYFLFQMWEESYQRVANEQEIYEGPRQPLLGAPVLELTPVPVGTGEQ